MKLTNFRFETDADGIALVTWDMPGRSMNVINTEVMSEIGSDRRQALRATPAIKGAVISLGKRCRRRGSDHAQDCGRRIRASSQGRGQRGGDARLRRSDEAVRI